MGGSSKWSKSSVLVNLLLNLEMENWESVRDRQNALLSASSDLPGRASSIRSCLSFGICRLGTWGGKQWDGWENPAFSLFPRFWMGMLLVQGTSGRLDAALCWVQVIRIWVSLVSSFMKRKQGYCFSGWGGERAFGSSRPTPSLSLKPGGSARTFSSSSAEPEFRATLKGK